MGLARKDLKYGVPQAQRDFLKHLQSDEERRFWRRHRWHLLGSMATVFVVGALSGYFITDPLLRAAGL